MRPLSRFRAALRHPVIVVAAGVLLLAAGCSRRSRGAAEPAAPDVMLNHFKPGYSSELWLNDEPVLFSATPATYYWAGWPLIQGENRAEIRVRALGPAVAESRTELVVREADEARAVLKLTGAVDASGRALQQSFLVAGAPADATRARAVRPGDEARARTAAMRLAAAFASLDNARLGEVLDLDAEQIARNWPDWITARRGQTDEGLRVTAVLEEADVTVLAGPHHFLARPSDAFINRARSTSLVRITAADTPDLLEFGQFVLFHDHEGAMWWRASAVAAATRVKE